MIRAILRVTVIAVLSIVVVAGAFASGFATSRTLYPPAITQDSNTPADWKSSFGVFWEAWGYVVHDFYVVPDQQAMVNGAVAGMVDSLGDPHTGFTDAKLAALSSSQLQGSFEGIGATVEMREGRLTIVAPLKGSPAEKAGLLPNDVILQVGSTVIQNMDVNAAVLLIRGPKGSAVTLLIQRAKQPNFTVSIVRDTIRTPFVESRMIEGTKIAYLRLNDFGATADDDIRTALGELLPQNPTGLIFDLRSDPGGYLNEAVDVASEFIKEGQPVVIEKDKLGNTQVLKAKGGGMATSIPMVVLVDGGSASASEIVTAAIKDYGRATLIGTKTYGKGSVQNVHTLSDQSELRVTIAHFFSPKGNEINDVGVTPDIVIQLTPDNVANNQDPQLDKAVEVLQGKAN
ncbi:MAG: S41 family peptidase [Chloroflexi bacterium]|nr:S41 family peptidase [Chloroflexota bacterium]